MLRSLLVHAIALLILVPLAGCENREQTLKKKADEFALRASKAGSQRELDKVLDEANQYTRSLKDIKEMEAFANAFKAAAQAYRVSIEVKKIIVPSR